VWVRTDGGADGTARLQDIWKGSASGFRLDGYHRFRRRSEEAVQLLQGYGRDEV